MNRSRCTYCSAPLDDEAVTLWDDRVYCRACVERLSPDLYALAQAGLPLEETVRGEDVSGWRFFVAMCKQCGSYLSVLFVLPLGIACLFGKIAPGEVAAFLGFIFGSFVIFIGLTAACTVIPLRRKLMPQTISADRGQLRVVQATADRSFDLVDCKWRFGNTDKDAICWFTGLRKGVVIQTPTGYCGLGHIPQSLEHWQAFLTLARVPPIAAKGCLQLLAIGIAGMAGGTAVGLALGHVAVWVTNVPAWYGALGFLGAFDGGGYAAAYASLNSDGVEATRSRLNPVLVGIASATIGLKCGFVMGWQGGVTLALCNGLLGWLFGRFCQHKLDEAETDRKMANTTRLKV